MKMRFYLLVLLVFCATMVQAEELKINMIVPESEEIVINSPVNEIYNGAVNISWNAIGADLYQIQYTSNGYEWINLTTTSETEYSWNASPGKYAVRVRGFKDGAWGGYQMSGQEPPRNYSDVLVLWTNNDKGSEEVANYYMQEMSIPAENKCYISITQGWDINKAQHEQLIQEIKSCIGSKPIKYVVFTRGMAVGYKNDWIGNPTKKSIDATAVYALDNASYYKMYSKYTSNGEPIPYVNLDFYSNAYLGHYKRITDFNITTKKNYNWEDSYVRGGSFSNNNHGFEEVIISKLTSNISINPLNVWSREAHIKIYEPEAVYTRNKEVVNAELHLFIRYAQTPMTLKLYTSNGLWTEKTITNNNKPTSTQPTGTTGGVTYGQLISEVTVVSGQQEVVFNITSYIKNAYFGSSEPLSFIIANDEDKLIYLWSSETPWKTRRPYLNLTYGKHLLAYGRLDGWSIDDAKALVDRSKQSWGKSGLVVLDQGSGEISDLSSINTYGGYETSLNETANIARRYGYDVIINNVQMGEPRIYITQQKAVGFLASWGSNDPVNPFNSASYVNNTWIPGAIVETAVSTSAATVTNKPVDYNGTQSKIADMIMDGASGARGSIAEPSIYGISRPHILFDTYVKGHTLGEAYLLASPKVLWEDLILGDPKMAPYKWSPFTVR